MRCFEQLRPTVTCVGDPDMGGGLGEQIEDRPRGPRHGALTTMAMELGLFGKVAVVTGASKGIGLAVTRSLAEEGASVIAGALHGSEELDLLSEKFEVHPVRVDLTDVHALHTVLAARPDAIVVDMGWPSAERPPGSAARIVTFGASRASGEAAAAILVGAGAAISRRTSRG